MISRGRRTTAALVTAGVLLVGCSGPSQAPEPEPTTEPSPTASAPAVELPDTDAGRQAAWVLAQIDAEPGTPVAEVEERFTQEFRDQLSPDQLTAVLDQLRTARPWTVTGVESGPTSVVAQISGSGEQLELQLAVDADGVIAGLFFGEGAPPRDPAPDAQALLEEVGRLPGSSLYVAHVRDGVCVPVEDLTGGAAAGDLLPIGSMVKLYVLGAVVDAVAAGTLGWQDEVTVTDALRSLPSGELQDAPAGTTLTVHEAARMMISISDNTATDLLLDAVGRSAVEQALVDMGHGDPAATLPVASTRELFHLGWGEAGLRSRWAAADEAGRRDLLAELPPGPPEIDPSAMTQVAAWPDGVDWFATGADVCAAHVALAERSGTEAGAPVREILAANPGLPLDPEVWEHVAYKGGSSVGTMAGSWYAEPAGGGDPVVVVVQTAARSAEEAVDARTMTGIAQDALRLATG